MPDESWRPPGANEPQHSNPEEPPRWGERTGPAEPESAPPPPPPYGQTPYGQAPYGQAPQGQAPYGQVPYGQAPQGQSPYGQNPYAQNPYGQNPSAQNPGAQQWAPAPRPGLIPLRPLSFGALLGTPFLVLRRNPKATFGVALLIQGVIAVVTAAVVGVVSFFAFSRIDQASSSDQGAVLAGGVGLIVLSTLVPVVLSIVAAGLLQGIIVREVASGILGEKLTVRALLQRLRGRVWLLVAWTVLTGVAAVVALLIGVLISIPLFAFSDNNGALIAVGVLVVILVVAALVVGFVWIGTKISLVPSAIALEKLSIGAAITRSWTLTRGHFWRTFGAQILVAMMLSIAAQVVTTPVSFLSSFAAPLLFPTDPDAAIPVLIATTVVTLAVSVVVGAVTSVVQSATSALIYVDLRMRVEGLDLRLQRHVEASAAGTATDDDPYLVDAAGGSRASAGDGNAAV